MDPEKQRAIARKGGQNVPDEKRSFSQNPELAAKAGRKGGQSVDPTKRSFSRDHRSRPRPDARAVTPPTAEAENSRGVIRGSFLRRRIAAG